LCGDDAPDAGEYPLNHAVLGGRVLANEPDLNVILKRPDVVGHVAKALAEFKTEDAALLPWVAALREFYQRASAENLAVIMVM
jgi:hypothetical protein